MNRMLNKFLLAGETFMHKMHLRQPGFIYIASGPFARNIERIGNLKKTQRIKDILIKLNWTKVVFNKI